MPPVREPVTSQAVARGEAGPINGTVIKNGPEPFGLGFAACDDPQADPWDDGAGDDVLAVVASAFAGPDDTPFDGADAVLGEALEMESADAETALGKLAWLYQFDETGTQDRPSKKGDPLEEAVAALLATF